MTTSIASHSTFLQDILNRQTKRRKTIDPDYTFPHQPEVRSNNHREPSPVSESTLGDLASKRNVINYVKEEETIRNDYCDWFAKSKENEFPSNWILGARDEEICEEYPALKKLMNLKSSLVSNHSHAPLYLQLPSDSPSAVQSGLGNNKFDVILINPLVSSWEQTSNFPIRQISSDPSFVFLWVGKGDNEGLERGRECFAKWGFRRAEDIVWVKTNKQDSSPKTDTHAADEDRENANTNPEQDGSLGSQSMTKRRKIESGSLFASQKEHCLMGIRGTVRRSTDMRFVHCNVDTDVMIWEGDDDRDSPVFPPYLYTLIENFCLGTRRLELFPTSPNPRRGWVTASTTPVSSITTEEVVPFDHTTYTVMITESDGRPVLPYHTEIDSLRPKSPQRRPRNLPGGSGGGNLTPNSTGNRPSPNPNPTSSGFRSQNRQRQQPQQQRNMGMSMQGFNPFNGQVNNPMMNPMGMMGMGVGMGMMPFGNNPYGQMGMGMGMGVNHGQPGNFAQIPMGMQMPMQMPVGMGMGMGMMPFGGGGGGFDPMNMGGFNPQQGQGNQNQQNQGGMGWQGNW
ncbi:hypothetical protein V865_001330 [Kwoniella europaea PYCC6329]|uniref:Transcription regulator n=1 Tax=Kwoniella europaea PYCC6329 TaxID=1423913 RepID=A0AAX4KAV3_9TREE